MLGWTVAFRGQEWARMDEDSLVDDFFLKKRPASKQSTASPATTATTAATPSTRTPRTASPIHRTPTTPRIWAETIPRRPKEQPRSLKPIRHHHPSTSTPRSPVCSSATITERTHSNISSISPTSPPPLPPPLDFSSPISSGLSTGLSTVISPSIILSSTRQIRPSSIPSTRKSALKLIRQPPSPCVQLKPSDRVSAAESDRGLVPESERVLVPDSTDSPQDLPSPPPDNFHEAHSDLESEPGRDSRGFHDHYDSIPQKLFNSSPSPPPKPVSRHSNGPGKDKGKARATDPGVNLTEETDEEKTREKLLADLGFFGEEGEFEEEGDARLQETAECVLFSSSPIEIVRPSGTAPLAAKGGATASTSKGAVQWQKSAADYPEKSRVLDISEWEDDLPFHPIQSGSSLAIITQDHETWIPCQEDQIRDIGVVIDHSENEDDTGIAPLMDSWPVAKRDIFLKMAGLQSDDGPTDEAAQAQATDDWDKLLGKGAKRSAGLAKKVVKKTWYNRSLFRAKKRGSKAFRGGGKSCRRVK